MRKLAEWLQNNHCAPESPSSARGSRGFRGRSTCTNSSTFGVKYRRGCKMELTLTPQEYELLLRILEQHHHQLLKEIWHTDSREFKLALQTDEKQLDSVLDRMRQAPAQPAHG